jgi:hypothetical protein
MTDVPDVDSAEALLLAAEELDAQAAAFRERARGRAIEAQQYRRAAQTLTLRPPPLAAHPLDALNGRRKLGEAVLAYLRNVDEAPISTIAEHVGDDAPYQRTRGVLDKLMEMGLVVRTGLKRGTRYHVAGEDEDVDATPTRSRYEELVRDVARELGTFTVQDVLDAADISHATAARWLRAWVDAGALEVERVGQANVYAYVRPLPPLNAPTMRPRSERSARPRARRRGARGDDARDETRLPADTRWRRRRARPEDGERPSLARQFARRAASQRGDSVSKPPPDDLMQWPKRELVRELERLRVFGGGS